MARIRSVKPEICLSETMAKLTAEEERTFVRLWTHCDDEGRAKDHPKLLKAALFPLHDDVTAEVIEGHLEALVRVGLIVRYGSGSDQTLVVTHWREHQHPQKAVPSKLPAPTPADLGVSPEDSTPTVALPEESRPVVEVVVVDVDVDGEVVTTPSTGVAAATETLRAPAAYVFELFWSAYPKKADKGAARKAWARIVKRVDPAAIIAGAERYRDDPNREDRYTKNPATWLNAESWDNPPLPGRGTRVDATRKNLVEALVKPAPTFKERMAAAGGKPALAEGEQHAVGSGS